MTLTIAQTVIRSRGDLSERSRAVLDLISSGVEWFDWAVGSTSRFAFPDEGELLTALQTGLHGSPLTLLPALGLAVSPLKLQTLSPSDLKTLVAAEESGAETALARARNVLPRHSLLDSDEHAKVSAFLSSLGVAQSPVFQLVGIQARAALHGLIALAAEAGDDLAKEAAAFAIAASNSPAEFADLFEFYLILAAGSDRPTASPEGRAASAQAVLGALWPRLFEHLEAPSVGRLVSPAEVEQAIAAWLLDGKTLGFTRLSLAAREVVAFGGNVEAADVGQAVRTCVEAASNLLRSVRITGGVMEQDSVCRYSVSDAALKVEVRLGVDGVITLDRVRRKA